jgi:type III secretion protein T
MNAGEQLGHIIGGLALVLPRIIAAFLILPLITAQSMPPLVRNSFFVSLAIIVYPVVSTVTPGVSISVGSVPLIVVKEIFIGLFFGFLFSSVFWAVSAAGNLIDTKVGSNFAIVADPIQGHETSLTGQLLTQLVAWLFMASGAFTLFIDLLIRSYTYWPVTQLLPEISLRGQEYVIDEFAALLTLTLMLAAPALVVLSLIDLSLGLINRYAPQLNIFQFTIPVKAWVATWIVLLSLGTFLTVVTRHIVANKAVLEILRRLF